MGHNHVGPGEYDDTSSAYIVRIDLPKPHIVLHQHQLLGVLLQIGGHKNEDEDPITALAREVVEESGYDMDQLTLLQPEGRVRGLVGVKQHPVPVSFLSHEFPGTEKAHFHTDVAFAFVTDQSPRYSPTGINPSDIRMKSSIELDELDPREIYPNVLQIARFVLDDCLVNWERIGPEEHGINNYDTKHV